MFGRYAFSVAGPMALNLLSGTVCDLAHLFDSFRHNFKTVLNLPVYAADCSCELYKFMIDINIDIHIMGHMWCMARFTAEGCQSAGGNARGAELQHFSSAPVSVSSH